MLDQTRKTMKSFIEKVVSLYILLILGFTVNAQELSGKIMDPTGKELPFANVVLMEEDSSFVNGTISEANGSFVINSEKSGNYLLKTSMIGYQTTYETISLPTSKTVNIELKEDTQQLDEVIVSAKKPLYEKKADRTVVNVRNRVSSKGQSALTILSRSPGVMVNQQSNSVSMYGKNGVMVMINGKISRLPQESIIQMLSSMSAANIEKIELITSPPAHYEAEGNAGLINIVMVENVDKGTNGNVTLGAGYNTGPTWDGSFNLNHRGNDFNFFLDYSFRSNDNNAPLVDRRTIYGDSFDQTIRSDQIRDYVETNHILRAGIEYDLNEKTNMNLLLTSSHRHWDLDAYSETVYRVSEDSMISTTMDIVEDNIEMDASASFGIRHRINAQQSLTMNLDYVYFVNDNPSQFDMVTDYNGSKEEELIDVSKDTPLDIKVVKIDYYNKFNDQLQFQAGLKGTISTFTNDVMVRNKFNEIWQENSDFTNFSTLDEKIGGIYTSLDWKPSDQISIYGGLRYEYTDSYLSSRSEQGLVDREFGNFFPNLKFSKKLGENTKVNASYSRRITRPQFNQMAPFVYFSGPNTFFSGNTALRPATTDNLDLSYLLKSWFISAKYSRINNSISRFQPELDRETNQQVYRSQNIEDFNIWSISSGLPIGITEWWEIREDVSVQYQSMQSAYQDSDITIGGVVAIVNGTSTFTLPKDFTVEISGNYISKQFWGIWEMKPMGQLDIGINKSLKNGSLTLSFSDIFHTNIWRMTANYPDNIARANWRYDVNLQSVNLTYSISFGNNKLKSVNLKSGSEEERNRLN